MTLNDYAALVLRMLRAQEAFFKDRNKSDLIRSKAIEKEVRLETNKILNGPGLFPPAEGPKP